MTNAMYDSSVPVFVAMMNNAKTWLVKAEAHAKAKSFDANVLTQSRLAPDMFTLAKQIQVATDNAKGCVARLAGVDIPKYEDTEVSCAELIARLDKTIAFVSSITAEQLAGSETREVVLPSRNGEVRMKGGEYLRLRATPNFFFHVTTAYAILRHNGVEVGKGDFLPAL